MPTADDILEMTRELADLTATTVCHQCQGDGACYACRVSDAHLPPFGYPGFELPETPQRSVGRCSSCGEGRCWTCRENPGKCSLCKGVGKLVDEERRFELYLLGLFGAVAVAHGSGDHATKERLLDEGHRLWLANASRVVEIMRSPSSCGRGDQGGRDALSGTRGLTKDDLRELGIEPEEP